MRVFIIPQPDELRMTEMPIRSLLGELDQGN